MFGLIRAELLKTKHSWLVRVSFVIAAFFPFLAVAMTLAAARDPLSVETRFFLVLRQSHLFLSLAMGNLLFPLIAIDLFFKEMQQGTVADIISVPVSRLRYMLAKEIVLFGWTVCLALASLFICLLAGIVLRLDGVSVEYMLAGLWRFAAVAVLLFLPLQLTILLTLVFRSYIVSLGVSIMILIGTIVAFNTRTFIFYYPFSIGFVLTNFAEAISPRQILISLLALAVTGVICLSGLLLRVNRMDM